MNSVIDWEDVLIKDPLTRIVHKAKKAPPFAKIVCVTSCGKRIFASKINLPWLGDRVGVYRWKEVKDKTITCLKCRQNIRQGRTTDGTK